MIIAGYREHPDFYAEDDEPISCPWCEAWHSADDDLCPAMPIAPELDVIGENDIDDEDDWRDWIGALAS